MSENERAFDREMKNWRCADGQENASENSKRWMTYQRIQGGWHWRTKLKCGTQNIAKKNVKN